MLGDIKLPKKSNIGAAIRNHHDIAQHRVATPFINKRLDVQ
jgi:hypothetical protein